MKKIFKQFIIVFFGVLIFNSTTIAGQQSLYLSDPNQAIKHQPSLNQTIHEAVKENNLVIVKKFLKDGGDPNLSSNSGLTLLFIAVGENLLEMTNILLESGANPNTFIMSAIAIFSHIIILPLVR